MTAIHQGFVIIATVQSARYTDHSPTIRTLLASVNFIATIVTSYHFLLLEIEMPLQQVATSRT